MKKKNSKLKTKIHCKLQMVIANSEWMKAIVHVMATTGADWIKEHPHGSFAPVRENTCAQW